MGTKWDEKSLPEKKRGITPHFFPDLALIVCQPWAQWRNLRFWTPVPAGIEIGKLNNEHRRTQQ
jgi:hypothetical protein